MRPAQLCAQHLMLLSLLLVTMVVVLVAHRVEGEFSNQPGPPPGQESLSDYEQLPAAGTATDPVSWQVSQKLMTVNGQAVNVTTFTLPTPAFQFAVFPPKGGCPGRVLTSVTAPAANCLAAMNAGFFDMKTGECLGNLISKGVPLLEQATQRVNLGLGKQGFTVGYLSSQDLQALQPSLQYLVSGAGWLIRQGQPYLNHSIPLEGLAPKFVTEKAPRTAVVLRPVPSSSSFSPSQVPHELLLVEVDGNERKLQGLDLMEWQSLLLGEPFHAQYAVNLDGGGSATMWTHTQGVINQPSDLCKQDPKHQCERTVTSIVCVVE